jgi:hypothetical protein
MKRDEAAADPELEPLFQRGRIIPPVEDVARARALARARSTIATASTLRGAQPIERRPHRLWFALAASFGFAVAAAAAAASYLHRVHSVPPTPRSSVTEVAVAERHVVEPEAPPQPAPTPPATTTPKVRRVRHVPAAPTHAKPAAEQPANPQESYAAELRLLQQAQASYASRNFLGTLVVVAQHGRRFPDGRLAEEREALRVRALVGCGRTEEAQRAVSAFARRFPRSALLPRLREAADVAN